MSKNSNTDDSVFKEGMFLSYHLVYSEVTFLLTTMELGHPQKYVAEMLATFTLTLALSLSLMFAFPFATALIAALVVGVFVYTIGPLSGAHINPAVTLGMWTIQKIETKDALLYVAAQLIGAGIATLFVLSMTATIPMIGAESPQIILGEAIGAFLLTFGVAAVASGKITQGSGGLVVGGSLLIGILIASPLSGGIVNPAVAFGLGAASVSYTLGPLLGGALGAVMYRYLYS